MTLLLIILLLSCCGFHFFPAEAQEFSNSFFTRHMDTKLNCSIYKTLMAVNRFDCHEKCTEELKCFSINFYQNENGTDVCELIKGTKSSLGKPGCLVRKKGIEHNEISNADFCSSSVSCKPGLNRKALPGSWYQLGSSAFKLFEQMKNYTEASAVCSANGETLATIDSDDENKFIAELFLEELKLAEILKPFKRWKLDGYDQDVTLFENVVAKKDENNISPALYFDGTTGSYATTPAWDVNKMTFSISLWVKLVESPSIKYYLYSYWSNPVLFCIRTDYFGVLEFNAKKDVATDQDLFVISGGKINLNKWAHVVAVWSRETKQATLYQDGSKVRQSPPLTQQDLDFPSPIRRVFDVGFKRDSGHIMKGWLRELLVFDRAVTSEEVNIIQDATMMDQRTWIGAPQSYMSMAPVLLPKTNCFTVRAWGTYQWEEVPCDRTMMFICEKLV